MSETEKNNGRVTLGSVDDPLGPGTKEVSGFTPTRYELIYLLEYWARMRIHTVFKVFASKVIGGTELRMASLAEDRIKYIESFLSEEEAKNVIARTETEYGEGQDKLGWYIFLHGTEEQREAHVTEWLVHTELEGAASDGDNDLPF